MEILMDPLENNNNNADGITVLTRTSKYGKLNFKLEMAEKNFGPNLSSSYWPPAMGLCSGT